MSIKDVQHVLEKEKAVNFNTVMISMLESKVKQLKKDE
jgi:hypothetical protein